LFGCGYCHLPNGQGRPENASLAGLPAGYIIGQIEGMKDGSRRSVAASSLAAAVMVALAKEVAPEEANAAATYFAGLTMRPWIKVVETANVPKTRNVAGIVVPADEGMEPIGRRILEVPEEPALAELRDPRAGFIAYVPQGSLAKGEALVLAGGGGRTIACGGCHGADLKGTAAIPGIAGRSPTYIVRALSDFHNRVRHSPGDQMAGTVARLRADDMIAIAAYLGSRAP
jgi:cytochrome c553